MKNFKNIIPLILALSLITPSASFAQESCNISKDLNNLISIKDDIKLTEKEKENKESEARRTLLTSVINCSIDEIADIKTRLDETDTTEDKEKEIKDSFNKELDNLKEYYEKNKEVIESIEDDQKLKDLATEILSVRENEYNDVTTNIVDFIFSFKQQKAINTTNDRLSKIKTSLEKILSIKDKEVSSLIKDSEEKVKKATELKNEAHNLIIEKYELSKAPEEAATSTIETIIEEIEEEIINKETATSTKEVIIEPRTLIKESLQNIKETYANFFKISQRVKELLGL